MDNGHTNDTTDGVAGDMHRERLEGGHDAGHAANHAASGLERRSAAQSHDPDYGFVDGSDLESGPLNAGDDAEETAEDEPNERDGRFSDARSEIGLEGEESEESADRASESSHEPTPEELEQQAEERADAEEAAAAYARASMMAFEAPAPERDAEDDDALEVHRGEKPKQLVVVNDVPGEETRIAILEQGKLAQFFAERAATATNVGSIYKARVVNVEPAIQAAFVDFGQGANGFLHISDLHPKYFPGDKDRTEKVGRKIPRRSRPLIQDALRRGMEITVQVLKEGLGSKGPTVTSYLSIPGRLLVMMPDMDNVGVSRKVDDEDGRRKMRKILDSLNLPEGFGFILRTAGFDSTRTELARDAQYLTRLWQVMEKRMNAVGAPCELYTEGDILLRTIRDSIDASVDGIVVDSESAFHRAKAFLEVVSPRTATKVHYWDRKTPVFHAFDIERQVDLIHAREVPLPSGGALVIDQAEALVAIDVNSGRSRSARDSETNAYNTNEEAVDEIARQLRLRDLGGVVVCDLIDMRSSKHRRDIEERFKKNLARDRAKTTVSQISEFGIVEMTRQRMRPSLRKTHYTDCPHCGGSGDIRMPDTVAADAMRRIQLVLDMERVSRVEVVCSSRVAGILLSKRRRALVELEDLFAKKVDIRISDAIPVDRVDVYAYDDRGADVDLGRPVKFQMPALSSLPTEIEEDDEEADGETPSQGQGRGRRRRRRRKPAPADATSIILSGGFDDLPELKDDEESVSDALARDEESDDDDASAEDGSTGASGADGERREGGRRKRRRRRGGRGRRDREDGDSTEGSGEAAKPARVAPPPPPREPSPAIRVHALAKEMEVTSKEVLATCAELGIEVKGHQSLLAGEQGDALRKAYKKPPFDQPEPEPEPEPAEEARGDGASSEGADGEGGGRRKRRRRRRRGRGGRDRHGAGEASSEGDSQDARGGSSDDGQGDGADADTDGDGAEGDEGPEGSDDESSESEGASAGAAQDSGDGEGGGRKRRRRRRRGRGGRGRDGESRGEGEPRGGSESRGGAEASAGDRENRGNRGERGGRDDRGGRGGRGERGGRGGRDDRGGRGGRDGNRGGDRSTPAAAPAPAPAPAPQPAARPRSLYGGRVRKLAPGERPKGGGDE